jgi:hypothetical protein
MELEEFPLLGDIADQQLEKAITHNALACAVVICQLGILVIVLLTCDYKLCMFSKLNYQFKPCI